MIDLATVLPKLIRAGGNSPELAEAAAKIAWTRVAGAGLRRQTAVFRLYRNTLIVSVADAIWQRQLHDMSAELVFRLNQLLGPNTINFIEFRVDPGTLARSQGNEVPAPRQREAAPPAELDFAADAIVDEELRDLFMRAAANCIARRDARTD